MSCPYLTHLTSVIAVRCWISSLQCFLRITLQSSRKGVLFPKVFLRTPPLAPVLSVQVLTSRGQSQIGNSFHRDQWVQEYLLETKKRSFSHTEKTHDSYKSTSTVRHYNQVRPFSLPYVYVGMIQEWLYNQRKTNLWSVRGQLKYFVWTADCMKTMRRRRFPLLLVKIGTAIFYSARDNTDHRHIYLISRSW